MMLDQKELLGVLSVAIAAISYAIYMNGIFRGQVKPHAFSWIIWGILEAIAFYAQWTGHAGPGAWATGITAVFCFVAAFFGYTHGEKNITRTDQISFIAALSAIPLWYFTKDPLWSVVMVTMIDALGFYPTFRKSYYKPYEEAALTYMLSSLKFALALLAITHYSLVTALYPASLVITNGAFVLMLAWRRRYVTLNPIIDI